MLRERVRERLQQNIYSTDINLQSLFPNICNMIQKLWNLLAINESLKGIFNCQPTTAFKRNKNLDELIESNKI